MWCHHCFDQNDPPWKTPCFSILVCLNQQYLQSVHCFAPIILFDKCSYFTSLRLTDCHTLSLWSALQALFLGQLLQSPPMKWQTKTESSPSYFACELRDEVGRVLRVKAGQKIRWRYRSRSTVHPSFNGPYTLHVAKLQCSKLSSTFSIVNHVSPLNLLTQPNQPLTHN